MAPFSKPETVLKQAEGLVSVGQSHAALQSLTDIFQSKRVRSTPLASLEPIVIRFIELCVEMRKGRTAKEGLMQYKNIAQNTSVGSIEVVIKRFVTLADQKVQEAQEKAERAVESLDDVDDLEATETPESVLLSAVSGDQSKDRTDRALVTPWLKFLWEAYRTALETLKNNDRLELIYQQIAQQAFKFCLKHSRKVEFRRLCETLRLHLANVAKYSHQTHAINLSDPDTLQRYLETRFAQLSAAVELELWQEAFRSVEDVHNLLTMTKKAPRPIMMAGYYEKLTRIFLMSGNSLYHAAAWSKYYSIVRTNPSANVAKLPEDDSMSKLAGTVLLSALAVPIYVEARDASTGRPTRSTALLGLTKAPTRASLLSSALASSTINNVPMLKTVPFAVKALHELLESSFNPLQLCAKAAPILSDLETVHDGLYKAYIPSLRLVIQSRLFNQLSQVYDSIETNNLLTLVKPLYGEEVAREKIESVIVSAASRGELIIKVDHATDSITFVDEVFSSPSQVVSSSLPSIQPSTAEAARIRLSTVANVLSNAITKIDAKTPAVFDFAALAATAEAERKALNLRRAIIARRRELHSELSARRDKETASRRAEAARREKDEEARRALEDVRRRELERIKKERENIKTEEVMRLAKSLKERGNLKVDIENVDALNTESLMKLQVEQLEKEKKEQTERIRIIAKRLDHFERAYRKEEHPLITKDYERQQIEDKETHKAAQAARIQGARETHELNMRTKERLSRMLGAYKQRRADIAGRRGEEYARKKEEAGRKIEEEKAKRRNAFAKARDEERRRIAEEERKRQEAEEEAARIEQDRLEEERRLEAEVQAKRDAELAAQRAKEEEALRSRAAREAERKKAEEDARRQREREEQAEERARQRKEQERQARLAPPRPTPVASDGWRRSGAAAPTPAPAPPVTSRTETPPAKILRAAAPSGGGWRAREQAKQGGALPNSGTATPPGRATPAPPANASSPNGAKPSDEDGFQTVKKNVYRPPRGRF